MNNMKIGDVFEITEDHLKLLREMHVYFDDYDYDGAPAIDGKRPYGNSGDVCYEVYRVLNGEDWNWDDDEEMTEDLHEKLYKIHVGTAAALQICLVFQKFETGRYKKTFYGCLSWEKIE